MSVVVAPGRTGKRATLADVKVDVNGTLTAIGGIYTTAGGADICSSAGTGVYNQQDNPGTETKTYQYTQKGSVTAHEIPITAAKLHNADGADEPYTLTAGSSAGDTFTYCKCQECKGKWVPNLKVAEIGTTKYDTLQEAVTKFPQNSSGNTYIKMLHSATGNVTTDKAIYLDLNGYTVTGDFDMGDKTLYGMDSATDTYDDAKAGKLDGTVTGNVALVHETSAKTVDGYDSLRYVAIKNEDGTEYTFHRFNISVSGYRFELATGGTPQCALFFIGKFQGDEAATDDLTSLGFTLKDNNNNLLGEAKYEFTADTVSPPMPKEGEEGTSEVVLSGDDYLFEVYLKRSFDKAKPDGYTKKISATAQAMFKNNGTQDSEPKLWSFEDAWTNPGELDETQQAILDKFLKELGITKQAE